MATQREIKNSSIATFLSVFPDNATSWRDATDEIRDLARTAKEYYNELDLDLLQSEVEEGQGRQALDFRVLNTPSAWNTQGKKYIKETLALMSENTFNAFYSRFENWFVK